MHLRHRATTALAAAGLGIMIWLGPAALAQSRFDDAEIKRAVETVSKDPQLAPQRRVKTLRWKDPLQPKRSATPGWLSWIAGLFSWLGQSARYLVWTAAALLAVLVARYVIAAARQRTGSPADVALPVPTHVRDLDIRPESLPDDIGTAARALWDAGEHRGALALLYRGLLSRLAHVHRVPIRDSTTEGDCLVLAANRLTRERHDYAEALIRTWQRAVYGREDVAPTAVHALCDRFAAAMNADAAGLHAGEAGA